LRRDGKSASIDGCEDLLSATAQQSFSDFVSYFVWTIKAARARFAEKFCAVGIGDDGFQMQLAVAQFG
jgi:hypothetical protein